MTAFRLETVGDLKVHVSRNQAYKAKYKALKLIEGEPKKQYELLWSFAAEIMRSNPGSTVLIETDGGDSRNRFDKMYVCLNAAKEGFINGCRPVICLDGCWLKGYYGGILLTACGIDGNNSYLPIAYAVVPKENTEVWAWFMRLIKDDLKILDPSKYTLMSDKQKGLIQAEQEEFPGAEVRFCARHLLSNFQNAGFKGAALKKLFWKAALCTTNNSFERVMDEIHKIDPKAEQWLRDKPSSEWCRAFFREFPRCDLLTNNACETFNANILNARKKPILSMFQDIHFYMMSRFAKNRSTARSSKRWKDVLCPRIQQIIDFYDDRITDYVPIEAHDYHFQVTSIHNMSDMYSVHMKAGNCGCGKWQVSGIPCIHAMVVISYKKWDVEPYVHKSYFVDSYRKTYALPVLPINSIDEWPHTYMLPIIPPVVSKVKVGRPTTKRRLEIGEKPVKEKKKKKVSQILPGGEKLKRQQQTVKCSRCGKMGHNARTCAPENVGASQTVSAVLQGEGSDQKEPLARKSKKCQNKVVTKRDLKSKSSANCQEEIVAGYNEETSTMVEHMVGENELVGGNIIEDARNQADETLLSSMIEQYTMTSQFQESQSSVNMVIPAVRDPNKAHASSGDFSRPMPEIIKDCKRFMTLSNIVKKAEQERGLKKK